MIIVCAGDSFTAGAELLEETMINGYSEFSLDKAFKVQLPNNTRRFDLSYPGLLKKKLGCHVFNLGESGCSQIDSMQRLMVRLAKFRKDHPKMKLVCILQNNFLERVWLKKDNKTKSVMLTGLRNTDIASYEISLTYIKYIIEDVMLSEYYLQSLALQYFCRNNDIDFLHFTIFDSREQLPISEQTQIIKKIANESRIDYIIEHKLSDIKKYKLPLGHINCEATEIMADWLIDEMKKRKIL
jgi:hypothetical protein